MTKSIANLNVDLTGYEYQPQALKVLRPYQTMVLQIPPGLGNEATMTLMSLFDCFDKAKEIKEGLVGDLLWGFAQVEPPIPPELTLEGLRQLYKAGYVKFQTTDNGFVDFTSSFMEKAWVRYQPKLLALVYEG